MYIYQISNSDIKISIDDEKIVNPPFFLNLLNNNWKVQVYQENVYASNAKFHSFKKVMSNMGNPYNAYVKFIINY